MAPSSLTALRTSDRISMRAPHCSSSVSAKCTGRLIKSRASQHSCVKRLRLPDKKLPEQSPYSATCRYSGDAEPLFDPRTYINGENHVCHYCRTRSKECEDSSQEHLDGR